MTDWQPDPRLVDAVADSLVIADLVDRETMARNVLARIEAERLRALRCQMCGGRVSLSAGTCWKCGTDPERAKW